MAKQVATDPAKGPNGGERAAYSSVVYVHGMGSQRRYEETSRLVDRLDHYLVRQHRRNQSVGMLSGVKARVEPLRPESAADDIVGYIRTRYSTGPREPAHETRFYEAYWAPVMAEVSSPWRVVKWLFTQPLRPWRTLRTPWRERQRLRRASLVALFERGRPPPRGAGEKDYSHLLKAYDEFEGLEAQRDYPAGTFDDFLAFIGDQFDDRPETVKRLHGVARVWLAAYRAEELRNAFVLTTMALALLLLAGGVVSGVLAGLQSLVGFPWVSDALRDAGIALKPDWKMAAGVAASLAGLVGLGRFLADYMGDVEAWATYEETDAKHTARNKTLDQCMKIMTHVLCDPLCERVTIVAHSLGTSVAHDALLALTRRNRARKSDDPIAGPLPMDKIEHFVTMGSPIDKIEYFFESYASQSHRYKRVVEALRGDIGTEPFSRNGKPHIHWINFWDEGDVISGALHSPASAAPYRQHVDNVHIASFHFPAPGASHSGYFDHERVIRDIFEIVYRRAGSFRTLAQPGPGKPYDYDSVDLGPGEPHGARSIYLLLMVATPWLVLVGLLAWLLNGVLIAWGAWMLAAAIVAVLILAYLGSKARGQRKPV